MLELACCGRAANARDVVRIVSCSPFAHGCLQDVHHLLLGRVESKRSTNEQLAFELRRRLSIWRFSRKRMFLALVEKGLTGDLRLPFSLQWRWRVFGLRVLKFRREGTEVEVAGLNQTSATKVDKFGVHDKDDAEDLLMRH